MDYIILDTTEPDDPELVKFIRANNISYEIVSQSGPGGGFPEIKYYANRDILKELIRVFWQDLDLFEDIKSVPKEVEVAENYFKVVADQGGVNMRKLCQDMPEAKIMAEYYEKSGFCPENIFIQEWQNGVFKDQTDWDELQASEISIGQVLGEIQDAMDHFSDCGNFGGGNGLSHKLIGTDQLGMDFESGERFIITIKQLS